METPAPPRPRFRARRWPVVLLVAVLVVSSGAAILYYGNVHGAQAEPKLQPVPSASSSVEASVPPAAAAPSPSPAPPAPIAASAVQQLYIPAPDPSMVIDDPVLAMPSNCRRVIEPPLDGPDIAKVFQCMDFAMPGTDTADNVVVAGHSSHYVTTTFNKLYQQGASLTGRYVYVRTAASGSQWLRYVVQNVYEPLKTDLPYQEQIWKPTPGRLILVTCLQEDGLEKSVKNFIVVAQFDSVQNR